MGKPALPEVNSMDDAEVNFYIDKLIECDSNLASKVRNLTIAEKRSLLDQLLSDAAIIGNAKYLCIYLRKGTPGETDFTEYFLNDETIQAAEATFDYVTYIASPEDAKLVGSALVKKYFGENAELPASCYPCLYFWKNRKEKKDTFKKWSYVPIAGLTGDEIFQIFTAFSDNVFHRYSLRKNIRKCRQKYRKLKNKNAPQENANKIALFVGILCAIATIAAAIITVVCK